MLPGETIATPPPGALAEDRDHRFGAAGVVGADRRRGRSGRRRRPWRWPGTAPWSRGRSWRSSRRRPGSRLCAPPACQLAPSRTSRIASFICSERCCESPCSGRSETTSASAVPWPPYWTAPQAEESTAVRPVRRRRCAAEGEDAIAAAAGLTRPRVVARREMQDPSTLTAATEALRNDKTRRERVESGEAGSHPAAS